jgi:hypothetical protein
MAVKAPRAERLYREFHQHEPRKLIVSSGRMPTRARLVGPAIEVQYRSNKKDPSTGQQPRSPIDYYHLHDEGVKVYVTDGRADTAVPAYIAKEKELVLLGTCLGAWADDDDQEIELKVVKPFPKLYAIPSGRALLIVQDEREILALIWGGRLGVEARGIVH